MVYTDSCDSITINVGTIFNNGKFFTNLLTENMALKIHFITKLQSEKSIMSVKNTDFDSCIKFLGH